eukprot:4060700-Pyramimonas_sp.AAC.1
MNGLQAQQAQRRTRAQNSPVVDQNVKRTGIHGAVLDARLCLPGLRVGGADAALADAAERQSDDPEAKPEPAQVE